MKRRPMPVLFPLADLPDSLVVQVLQKTRPIPFARLRRSTKWLDTVAEDNRKYIGSLLYRLHVIALTDKDRVQWGLKPYSGVYHESDYFDTTPQLLFFPFKDANIVHKKYLTLSEACKHLSGFSFSQIHIEGTRSIRSSDISSFFRFLRQQRWHIKAASVGKPLGAQTQFDSLGIIKPKILIVRVNDDLSNIPKCVETVEALDALLPNNIKDIAKHVKNFIVAPAKLTYNREICLPSFIKQIVCAFYNNELSISYAQVHNLYFHDVRIVHISHPNSTTAATELLTYYIQETPYEGKTMINSHKFYHSNRDLTYRKRVTVVNLNLSSKTGQQGLLAARTDVLYSARGNVKIFAVSVYFWKDRDQHVLATKESYGMDSCRIR